MVGGDHVDLEPVTRLHALLVEAVRRRRGADAHAAPVTVAEIYQDLVPYRNVRSALGLEMNADYEHTLLRLLSGEGGLARVEPAAAKEQMERELDSPNPNVALYRKFAGCDVWLTGTGATPPAWVVEHLAETEAVDSAAAAPTEPLDEVTEEEAGDVVSPATAAPPTPPTTGAEFPPPQQEQPQAMTSKQARFEVEVQAIAGDLPATAAERKPVGEAGRCLFCDSALPASRQVRFCPFCGQDQSQRPCVVCGEPLQPDWAYCIACGEAAATADA